MAESAPIILQVGTKILLKNKEGKFLLLRRNPKKYPEVGPKWDIVGGRINPGTSLLENLTREVREETKLEIIGTPRLAGAQDILRIPGKHVVRLSYEGEADGTPIIDEESHEWKWFSPDEIASIPKAELDEYFSVLLASGALRLSK